MSWSEAAQPRGMSPKAGVGRNYAKTAMLMALLIALLAIGGNVVGGMQGMLLFGGLGLVFNFVSYWFSDRLALMAHRARPVTREELPQVYEIVERLTRRAGMPMPRVYVIPSETPNAFATGRNPSHAAVAVTEGILRILDRRQLEGVLAHELAHVRNRDILISTIAAAVAGLISTLGYVVRWGALLGGMRREDDRGGSALELLAWAILAPLVALVIQLAVSRSREYGADASGAELVGDPEPLAEALLALERGNEAIPYQYGGPATAHLFIVNPFHGAGAKMMSLFSTHPPIEERVRRLREMRRGVRYA
ncbi:zinc metalloprotease HtpX [Anaeromyxobacter dehalogenans]|uniref:Protease HtpX homolog n=1 Tax=Anaeromyxobacter dehalogenans (strain 2CP-C) TaxID=290397 RepID=Q2ILT2_ANADE|nr:zinc metalloprotease HtpX [Anaeromyxobacter dehalogenans]ABC82611.1 Heat shock protein, Metallo peptidase, MEROPS family M48B [Anaeromyxobacter dehalogenans 2CP-C]